MIQMGFKQLVKANYDKKYYFNKAKLELDAACQKSIHESLCRMDLNERMHFVQKNQKFFEVQEVELDERQSNGEETRESEEPEDPEANKAVSCTIDLETISLSHKMTLALALT